jgi:hypothetical protein
MAVWNILRPSGICFYVWQFGNVVVIWYNFPFLVYCTKKNLATLLNNEGNQWFGNLFTVFDGS